jgi:rhodanese-related sulfurtransferase
MTSEWVVENPVPSVLRAGIEGWADAGYPIQKS